MLALDSIENLPYIWPFRGPARAAVLKTYIDMLILLPVILGCLSPSIHDMQQLGFSLL